MFDPSAVVEIDLGGLSPEEIDALAAEPDEYQPGTFGLSVDGIPQGPPLGEVGIRLKGGLGSFRPLTRKAAFKVKFGEYVDDQTFFGLEKLTLNNMVQDPSMLHEVLSYELFRALGVAAPRTGYAFVRLNGEDFGLHLNVETLDMVSLPRWFPSTRHLYEADKPGVDVEPGGAGLFEVDEGKSSKREDLEALIAAAGAKAGDWSDGMAAVADLEQMTRMWAVERYVGHWDGYAGVDGPIYSPNNYYLHSVESGLFSMLPWGSDQTWGVHVEFGERAGGLLFNRCYADASCRALYVEALREVQSSLPALDLDARAAQLAAMLLPWQALEPVSRREYSAAEIEAGVESTRDFVATRPGELVAWLSPTEAPGPESAATGPPRIVVDRTHRIGPSFVSGPFVATRLWVLGAGRAAQHVSATFEGRRRLVCRGQSRSDRAGTLTVRCRLSDAARRRLASGPLTLRIAVAFVPRAGKPLSDTRRLTVPKRS